MPQPPPPSGNNGTGADPLRGEGGEEIEDETDGGDRIGVKLVLREDESDVEGETLEALSVRNATCYARFTGRRGRL